MRRSFLIPAGLLVLSTLVTGLYAGSPAVTTTFKINLFTQSVDEQNLDAYYGIPGHCSEFPASFPARFLGDTANPGPTSAYDVSSTWQTVGSLSSSQYVDGGSCNTSSRVCIGAGFNHSGNTLSLDTRGTQGPRVLTVDFGETCGTCGVPGSNTALGGRLGTPALVSVFLDVGFTDMAICSSRACLEAEAAFVKLWFDDPNPTLKNQKWRVDWPYVRVLRMSANTWYVVANACDGSQVSSLYKLQNDKRRSSTSLQGQYLMPFLLTVVK